jgi:2'-5' RNA ligase
VTLSGVRVFAALELPPEIRDRIADLSAGLNSALPKGGVRWVRADGIHLTLKFYGDVDSERLPELQAALTTTAQSARPLSLEMEGLGVFPNPVHPRVVWVGVAGDLTRLRALRQRVDEASAALGFKPETRPFTPHLTLGRARDHLKPLEKQALAQALERYRAQVGQLGAFTVEALSLMRSVLKPTGAEYTPLFAARLGEG